MRFEYAHEAVGRVIDVAIAALSSADLRGDPRDVVAGPLLQAIGADLICFNQAGPTVDTTRIWALAPALPLHLIPQEGAAFDLLSNHPLVQMYVGGDSGVLATSDLPPTVWDSCDAAHLVRTVAGVRQQLAIQVPAEQHEGIRAWVAMRSSGDFDEHDKDAARLLRPVLVAVERHAQNLRRLLDSDGAITITAATVGLTSRESVVLGMFAEGLTGGAIARRLHISPRTVEKHAEHIYRKLDVTDRLGAVLEAQRLGAVRSSS